MHLQALPILLHAAAQPTPDNEQSGRAIQSCSVKLRLVCGLYWDVRFWLWMSCVVVLACGFLTCAAVSEKAKLRTCGGGQVTAQLQHVCSSPTRHPTLRSSRLYTYTK